MRRFSCLLLAASMLTLSACETMSNAGIKKEHVGTAAGAIGGAWIGSNVGKGKGNIAAIAAGTLLGAYLGNQVGASLDRADLAYHNQTSQTSLESNKDGVASSWNNPNTGASGTVTPVKTYRAASGEYCREFQQDIQVGGKNEQAYGTACRQPDGSWKIIQ